MCKAFSFLSDGNGKVYILDAKTRRELAKKGKPVDDFDSHSFISYHFGISQDRCNAWETEFQGMYDGKPSMILAEDRRSRIIPNDRKLVEEWFLNYDWMPIINSGLYKIDISLATSFEFPNRLQRICKVRLYEGSTALTIPKSVRFIDSLIIGNTRIPLLIFEGDPEIPSRIFLPHGCKVKLPKGTHLRIKDGYVIDKRSPVHNLVKYHKKQFSAIINGCKTKGRVYSAGGEVFLCQNDQRGCEAPDFLGYDCSWTIDDMTKIRSYAVNNLKIFDGKGKIIFEQRQY